MADTGYDVVHKVKRIQFFGRSVPVVLQNENGPCPLLGVANVLLLRNALQLPSGAQHISQDRLLSLIAEFLLDSVQASESGGDALQAANQQQNVADAIAHLPKLTTGLDVNVRFDRGVYSFEFTDEVAVFDLLGISLVHGWLIDTENKDLKKAIKGRSYNELVCWLIPLIGQDSDMAQKLLSPAGSGLISDLLASVRSGISPQLHAGNSGDPEAVAALEEAMAMSMEGSSAAESRAPQMEASEEEALDSIVARLVSGVLSCAVSQGPGSAEKPAARAMESLSSKVEGSSITELPEAETTEEESLDSIAARLVSDVLSCVVSRGPGPAENPPVTVPEDTSSTGEGSLSATAGSSVAALSEVVSVSGVSQAAEGDKAASGEAADALEVALVQDFLDSSASQLTQHGISSLRDTLRPNELAVFFRNNHFSTMFNHEGALYLLITDEGFLHEPEVVWERLESVYGATTFCTSELKPFEPHKDAASTAVALAQAAFASVTVPAAAGQAEAELQAGDPSCDADFALALQLQEQMEEEERQARQQHETGQQQQGQHESRTARPPPGPQQEQQSGTARPPQQQQRRPTQQQQQRQPVPLSTSMETKLKEAKDKCAIM